MLNKQNETAEKKKKLNNSRLGIVLFIVIIFVLINYSNIVAFSQRQYQPLFSGSEAENWLFFVFWLIPIFWLINVIHSLMFPISVLVLSGVIGLMLLLMHNRAKEMIKNEDEVTPLQKFCNACYLKLSILFFAGAGVIPAVWFLFIR